MRLTTIIGPPVNLIPRSGSYNAPKCTSDPRLTSCRVTTKARYLNVKDDYLQELIERKPLTLLKRI